MAVGAGLVSPPIVEINTMNAITTKYLQPIMGDATFQPSPVFGEFFREGTKMESASIPYAVASSQDASGGAYWGAQTLAANVTDNVTPAESQWKFYRQPIVIPETDLLLNLASNPAGVQNIMRSKLMIAAGSFLTLLSNGLWGDTTQPASLRIDDLIAWLNTSNNVIAGIDRTQGANAFWLPNPSYNMNNNTTIPGLTTAFWQYAGKMGYDYPQVFFTGPANYAAMEPLFTQNIRYVSDENDRRSVQAGFRQHFMFKTMVVIGDPYMATLAPNVGLYINYNYIYPVFFQLLYFNFRPWMSPSMQFIMVSYIRLGWQIVCLSPQKAGIALINMGV